MSKQVSVIRDTVVFGLPEVPSWEQLTAYAHKVVTLRKHWPMIVGEIAHKALAAYGDKAWQLLDDFGYSHQAVINFKFMYARCREQYTDALPNSFWQDCAGIEDNAMREEFITHALSKGWRRADWRAILPSYTGKPVQDPENAPAGTATQTAAIPKAVNITKLLRLVTEAAQSISPFAEELVVAGQELQETTISAVTLEALRRTWDDLNAAAMAMFTAFEVPNGSNVEQSGEAIRVAQG